MPVLLHLARGTTRGTAREATAKTAIDADQRKKHVGHRTRDDNKETPITSAIKLTVMATAETKTEIGHRQTAEKLKAKTVTATTGARQIQTASINTEAVTGTGKIRHVSQRDK